MAELRVKETGTIKLFESDNTSSVTIASPASLGADRTITLPDASVTLASGTMLATDGSGASLTALNASELGSGTVPTARLGSGTASSSTILYGDQTYKTAPSGTVKQIKTATRDSAWTDNSSISWVDIPDLEIDIVPETGSDVWLTTSINGVCQLYESGIRFTRGGTAIGVGDSGTYAQTGGQLWYSNSGDYTYTMVRHTTGNFVDTNPGGDGSTTITYKVQALTNTNTFYLNVRASSLTTISTLTAVEFTP
jgi:hypothetical protein